MVCDVTRGVRCATPAICRAASWTSANVGRIGRLDDMAGRYAIIRVLQRVVVAADDHRPRSVAGWSSPVARWAHNPKVAGSNPAPATNCTGMERSPVSGDLLV